MNAFSKSFVVISYEHVDSGDTPASNDEPQIAVANMLSDLSMIEEITIAVRIDARDVDCEERISDGEDMEAIAALDPLSQLLWLQALQHLH